MFDNSMADVAVRMTREGLYLALVMSAPPLVVSMIVGVAVGLFQSATQIQEQTLSFVAKLAVLMLVVVTTGPVMGALAMDFLKNMLGMISSIR